MNIIKNSLKDGHNTMEFNHIEDINKLDNILKSYSNVNEYKAYMDLYLKIEKQYYKFNKSLLEDRSSTIEALVWFINLIKQYLEKSQKDNLLSKLKDLKIDTAELEKSFNCILDNKGYNLLYNMRNYEQHCGGKLPITTKENINEEFEIYADIPILISTLQDRPPRRKLENQFQGETKVKINDYIVEAFKTIFDLNQTIYRFILQNHDCLYMDCVKLYQFYRGYEKVENEMYEVYFTNSSMQELASGTSNTIDMQYLDRRFIHYLLILQGGFVAHEKLEPNDTYKPSEIYKHEDCDFISGSVKIYYDMEKVDLFLIPNCLSYKEINELSKVYKL
jgi:hypothetical protein